MGWGRTSSSEKRFEKEGDRKEDGQRRGGRECGPEEGEGEAEKQKERQKVKGEESNGGMHSEMQTHAAQRPGWPESLIS